MRPHRQLSKEKPHDLGGACVPATRNLPDGSEGEVTRVVFTGATRQAYTIDMVGTGCRCQCLPSTFFENLPNCNCHIGR